MRISIKTLMLCAFSVIIAMLLVQGWTGVSTVRKLHEDIERLSAVSMETIDAANQLDTAAARLRIFEHSHVLHMHSDEFADIEARMEEEWAHVETLAARVGRLDLTPEERRQAEEFESRWRSYGERHGELVELSREGRDIEALELLTGDLEAAYDGVSGTLDDLVAMSEAGAEGSLAEARGDYRAAVARTWTVLGLGVAIGVGGVAFVFFGVARPLERITHAMRAVSNGNLEAEIPHARRRDEVGDMAGALAVFRDGLAEAQALREHQAAAESEAAARRKAELHEIADNFERAAGQIVQMVSSASTELQAAAATLSASSEETNSQAATVSAAAQQASASVQTVAAAIEELVASASEIGAQMTRSTDVVGAASSRANETNDRMKGLRTDADRIGEIVAMIEGIAEQTNLLALNATIEASRAGDAGRGFAVVAQEVKALAGQTAKATSEISAQIDGMQTSSADAAGAIHGVAHVITEVSDIASAVAAAVQEQRAATQDIAHNMQDAAHGTQEVTENIASVSKAAQESAAAAAQVLSSAGELAQQSAELRRQVDIFLSTVRAA